MKTALYKARIVSDGKITEGKAILIDGKLIEDIIDESEIPDNVTRISLENNFIAPGYSDTV